MSCGCGSHEKKYHGHEKPEQKKYYCEPCDEKKHEHCKPKPPCKEECKPLHHHHDHIGTFHAHACLPDYYEPERNGWLEQCYKDHCGCCAPFKGLYEYDEFYDTYRGYRGWGYDGKHYTGCGYPKQPQNILVVYGERDIREYPVNGSKAQYMNKYSIL